MHVKFTHFCITQPQFRRCLLFWFLLEKELFILKKEYLMLKERTQWLVKLSKLVPDTFCWLLLQKKKLTEEANIFIFHSGHQCTFMRYGKQTYLFTNTFVFRPVRYQSILQDDWRIYLSLLVTPTMIENIFFEGYRIRKKLWYKCPWSKSPADLGEDSWKYFRSKRVKTMLEKCKISPFFSWHFPEISAS